MISAAELEQAERAMRLRAGITRAERLRELSERILLALIASQTRSDGPLADLAVGMAERFEARLAEAARGDA